VARSADGAFHDAFDLHQPVLSMSSDDLHADAMTESPASGGESLRIGTFSVVGFVKIDIADTCGGYGRSAAVCVGQTNEHCGRRNQRMVAWWEAPRPGDAFALGDGGLPAGPLVSGRPLRPPSRRASGAPARNGRAYATGRPAPRVDATVIALELGNADLTVMEHVRFCTANMSQVATKSAARSSRAANKPRGAGQPGVR
jgi:hypothetical protein